MDTEQQVRLNFLEEVEDYFDQIEAVALNLTTAKLDIAELDRAMRAAHSVKGGAGMMGFVTLSQVAHRLEDFFKILRVRGDSLEINAQLESLFLKGIDALRLVARHNRQGGDPDNTLMKTQIQPIFTQLRSHLGDLRPEDEERLLAQEENVDVAIIIFSGGVEDCLDDLEAKLAQIPGQQIATELTVAAEQLAEFGRMSELDNFVQLCEDVRSHAFQINSEFLAAFAQAALATWRRSHALVLIGRTSHLPHALAINADWLNPSEPTSTERDNDAEEPVNTTAGTANNAHIISAEEMTANWLNPEIESEMSELTYPDWLDEENLDDLQAFVGNFGTADLELDTELPNIVEELETFSDGTADVIFSEVSSEIATDMEAASDSAEAPLKTVNAQQDTTVRVSAQQLQQLNTLFGKLVVERNAIDLRLSQLHSLVTLMQERMEQLEQSNHQLQHWYDTASTTEFRSTPVSAGMPSHRTAQPLAQTLASLAITEPHAQLHQQFDALEFDRYTDLHLLSQEQMESIVQLQEVSSDITFSLREASTATAALHYTARALQSGITKIQMRPFSTLVKRFPRVMRDLALQHHKQVSLNIQGELTLIDRVAIEALADPLNHLLRNAFDHGIETPEERIAAGKPAEGTISIRALHRGNQIFITIQDDGRGIDLAKIRSRLKRLGMSMHEIQKLSDHDLLDIIFEPGFSTAEQVTELSGRGVGMDIVGTNLQRIRGDIHVATQLGQGTTFTIQVPLAVSVLRVMLVESAHLVFAVPINSIQGMVSLHPEISSNRQSVTQTQQVIWEGQAIDLIHLEDWLRFNTAVHTFEMEGTPTINQPTALVIDQDGQLRGLCIDRFWGEQEISLSPLKSPVKLPKGLSGTSILGDGRVIPLVDPYQLLASIAEQQKTQATLASLASESLQLVPPVSPSAATDGLLPTVLVVDDSSNVRRYLAITLEKAGYQVEQARDGQEAIDKLTAGLKVKAMICDIEMPRLDGYGVLSELRSHPDYQQLPIAMLTSRMNDKHRKLAMNLGASAYFSKPYNEQALLQTLQTLIEAPKLQLA